MLRQILAGLFALAVAAAWAEIRITGKIINDDIEPEEPDDEVVNWLDDSGYTKPAYYPLSLPSEDGAANKYWIDLSNGSGSTCSSASPCDSFSDLCGKTTTGGTYVYVKGNGRIDLTTCSFAGTSDVPVVIKPWPNDSTPTVLTAANGCQISNANRITASGVEHVIFDGGPDMLIRFVGSGCTTNQNGYTLVVNSNNITLRRVRIDANNSSGPALGVATGASASGFRFVNSEIYNANRYYGVYTGGGSSCPGGSNGHTNLEFRNSIFRDIDGRGIQIEPRANSSGFIIDGNVFYNVGYCNSCGMGISGAVQIADACNGETTGVVVSNNLFWNLGGGAVLIFQGVSSDSDVKVYHNTIWNYANKSNPTLNSHAISCWTDGCNGDVRNNIILAPARAGLNPINRGSGLSTNDNLCESGSSCGSGALSGTASTVFVSTSTSSSSFLFPTGNALGNAILLSGFELDYLRGIRSGAVDVGAIEQ